MRLTELFKHTLASKLGGKNFATSIDGEQTLNPHQVMDKCLQTYYNVPFINSGITNLVLFIMGDKMEFTSADTKTKKFLNSWFNRRVYLKNEIKHSMIMSVTSGNSFCEPVLVNNKFDGFVTYPDPSRIYRNLDVENDTNYWLLQFPEEVRSYGDMKPSRWQVKYIVGDIMWDNVIWAVPFNKKKFHHLKLGMSRDGIYGRSFLASTNNDNDIMTSILKNISTIAKFKALNTKLIMPAAEQEEFLEDDLQFIEDQMLALKSGDDVVLNKKIAQETIAHQGEYDSMSNELEYLRKDTSSGLLPNYLTPWSNDNARATASEAKIPFKLLLESLQFVFEEFFTALIVGELRKEFPWLKLDAKLKLGNIQLESLDTMSTIAGQMYRDGVLTMNEYRKMVGLVTVKDGDKYLSMQENNHSAQLTNSEKLHPRAILPTKTEHTSTPEEKK